MHSECTHFIKQKRELGFVGFFEDFERERERERTSRTGTETEAGSMLSREPNMGLNPRTLGS